MKKANVEIKNRSGLFEAIRSIATVQSIALIALVAIIGFTIAGCSDVDGPSKINPRCDCTQNVHPHGSPCTCFAAGTSACTCVEESSPNTAIPITSAEINITAPVKGSAPSTTATGTGDFSIGTVSWSPADNPFKGGEVYTATVTLTANSNHTFTGLSHSTVNGQNADVSNNTGEAVTLSHTFAVTDTRTATALAIKTQPDKLTYTHGEALDLTGLEVTLTFDDNSSNDVDVANFSSHNITASPSNGDHLVKSTHDNQPVKITYGDLHQDTNNLTVNAKIITFTVDTIAAQTYNGSAHTPAVTVKDGAATLALTTDYTVGYSNNTNAGTATVTVTGAGNYAGSTGSGSFTINKATPTVTTWPTAAAITHGAELSASALSGGNASVAGTFAWTNGAVIPTVSNSGYEVTFTPTDTANYNTVAHNVSITVNDAPPSVLVSFNTNGGGSIPAQTVTTGKASRPANPTRSNFTFDYWYTDAGFTTPYDFDTILTGNIMLYARWVSQTEITEMLTKDMVFVPGGTFEMGKDLGTGTTDVTPLHMVTLSGFWMARNEVTQVQWQTVMGTTPSSFTTGVTSGETQNRRPVERVTWYDAVEFCIKLSEQEGLTPVYTLTDRSPATGRITNGATVTVDWTKNGYRLPTEAQWEYAAKGGDPTAAGWVGYTYAGSNTPGDVAWLYNNSNDRTHEVRRKTANKLGLYDMSGNVWEWCWDWYAGYSGEAQINPIGASSGTYRVHRGGSWSNSASSIRSAYRIDHHPTDYDTDIGFRIARNVN